MELLATGSEVRRSRFGYAIELLPPTGSVRAIYARNRCEHSRAESVLRCARAWVAFREAHDKGLVRLLYVADDDGSSALEWLEQDAGDMAQGNSRSWEATRKQERARAERDGVWGLVAQYRVSEHEDWEDADSCWGFVGEDGRGVMYYAIDLARAALNALADAPTCPTCGRAVCA